ncbi:glycoside hydrolase superfamily [Entophlyctis helioformis]|nr:glycoside hydrolase superfamily [Entophlyctis helioformis]
MRFNAACVSAVSALWWIALVMFAGPSPSSAQLLTDLAPHRQTTILTAALTRNYEGWGTSLCWWANFAGALDRCKFKKLMDLLFSRTKYPSLGLNIVRYNIGGSPPTTWDGFTPSDKLLGRFRGIPSFQTGPGSWNWDADMGQRRTLAAAKVAGANVFEAFSNSPPWWMTISQTARGSFTGDDNLNPANYTQFAVYLATVVRQFRLFYGINFTSLEPFNEPNVFWWRADPVKTGQQEGCRFAPRSQKAFLPFLVRAMETAGLSRTVELTTADEYAYNWAGFNLNEGADFSVSAKANVHGYGFSMPAMNDFRRMYRNRVPANINRVWLSEVGGFGRTNESVAQMAATIMHDLNIARVTGWVYWQVLDTHPDWSLIHPMASCERCYWFDPGTFDPVPNAAFYTLMQFTNHIPQGSTILNTTRSFVPDGCVVCVVASFHPVRRRLTIVATNTNNVTNINHLFDVSRFLTVSSRTRGLVYRTAPSRGEFHAAMLEPTMGDTKTFTYVLPALSTTTFEFANVTMPTG